jgi:hypothetical protein
VKQYKELLKCSFGDEPDKFIFQETICELISNLINVPIDKVKEFSIVDIMLFILQLRTNSQGNAINIVVTKDEKQMTLPLDLNYVKSSINNFYKEQQTIIKDNNIQIHLNPCSVNRFLDSIDEEYLYFFDKIIINNKEFKIKTNKEAAEVFDKLPPKLSLQIIEWFKDFITKCSSTNFLLKYEVEQTLTFLPSIDSLIWYTKLIFNESLDTFYTNLFYLSHLGHIDLSYVESLSPGEYTFMVKKLEASLSKNSSSSNMEEPVDDSGMFENEL